MMTTRPAQARRRTSYACLSGSCRTDRNLRYPPRRRARASPRGRAPPGARPRPVDAGERGARPGARRNAAARARLRRPLGRPGGAPARGAPVQRPAAPAVRRQALARRDADGRRGSLAPPERPRRRRESRAARTLDARPLGRGDRGRSPLRPRLGGHEGRDRLDAPRGRGGTVDRRAPRSSCLPERHRGGVRRERRARGVPRRPARGRDRDRRADRGRDRDDRSRRHLGAADVRGAVRPRAIGRRTSQPDRRSDDGDHGAPWARGRAERRARARVLRCRVALPPERRRPARRRLAVDSPGIAELDVRLGFPIRMEPEQAQARLATAVREAVPDARVEFRGFRARGYDFPKDGALASLLGECHAEIHGGHPPFEAGRATTDLRWFSGEAACYGPASSGSHGTDEWVSLSTIAEDATVLALLLRRWGAES